MTTEPDFVVTYSFDPSNEQRRIPRELSQLQRKLIQLFDETYTNFFKFNLDWYVDLSKKEILKSFATEKHPLLTYHLRAISERIKIVFHPFLKGGKRYAAMPT